MSAMAGVTKPTIISGMMNPRNSLKIPLKVMNRRTIAAGRKFPNRMPNAMAMIILPSKPILMLFMYDIIIVSRKDTNKRARNKNLTSIFFTANERFGDLS
jgi:hypothetical protein